MDAQQKRRKKILHGNTLTGLLFLIVGGALLLRQFGYPLPPWLFSWEMILIVVGFFIGLRNGFRDFSWLIIIVIGLVFLSDRLYPGVQLRQYAVPAIIIILGLICIFSPRFKGFCGTKMKGRRSGYEPGDDYREQLSPATSEATDTAYLAGTYDSFIDIVSIFSGIKKKVLSKNFTGGDVVCIFGGAELNLTNADFVSPVVIEFVQIFGGTKLVVPSNWEVRSEVTAIFGGIEDKRPQPPNNIPEKTLIIQGSVIFGGVEINCFN